MLKRTQSQSQMHLASQCKLVKTEIIRTQVFHTSIISSITQTVLECRRSANPWKPAKPWLKRRCWCSPGGAVTVNFGTLSCGPADSGPECSDKLPISRGRNDLRRRLAGCEGTGGNAIDPAKLLLLARFAGITSSVVFPSDLSDALRSVSDEVGDSRKISSGGGVFSGSPGLDTFFGRWIFAIRHRMLTYSLSPVLGGTCGGRDIACRLPA